MSNEHEVNPLEEKKQAQADAFGWLFEMEVLDDPNVHNALMLNIFKVSKHIKDVQIVADHRQRKMLVYLELSRWGTWFCKKDIENRVLAGLMGVLPSFKFRITFEQEILNKSLEIAKKHL